MPRDRGRGNSQRLLGPPAAFDNGTDTVKSSTKHIPRSYRVMPPHRSRGFTLVEILIAVGILALLLGITLAAVHRTSRAATSVQCLSNLRQIQTAFTLYAERSGGFYPHPYSAGTSWEGSIRPFLSSTRVFICPSDEEIAPIMGSSYDWRDLPDERTTLAGRAMTNVKRSDAVLAFESLPGWHARKKMNAVRIDGAAVTMEQDDCMEDLTQPIR